MTFKQIPGYPNYEINEIGVVRNINRQRTLNPWLNGPKSKCYYSVELNGSTLPVHRLIAITFLGPANGRVCRHLDDDPTNNCLSNLAWGSRSENALDALKNQCMGKLNKRKVKVIRGLAKCGFTHQRISEIFTVTRSTISQVIRRQTWKHVV